MAKAKRERRTSIRTMPAEGALSALEALEQAERETQTAGQRAPDGAPAEPVVPDDSKGKA
jgi:hypothetical protein